MNEFASLRDAVLAYVKEKHNGQMRAGGNVPVWHHLDRVSRYLEITFQATNEGSEDDRSHILLGALCHDALEDTDATSAEIATVAGKRASELAEAMTNHEGDDHQEAYVRQVATAEEAVRLIKLSDLYDNVTGAVYMMHTLGVLWVEGYLLPIITPMISAIEQTKFERYPKTSSHLMMSVRASFETLNEEMRRYQSPGP